MGTAAAPTPNKTMPPIQSSIVSVMWAEMISTPTFPVQETTTMPFASRPRMPFARRPSRPHSQKKTINTGRAEDMASIRAEVTHVCCWFIRSSPIHLHRQAWRNLSGLVFHAGITCTRRLPHWVHLSRFPEPPPGPPQEPSAACSSLALIPPPNPQENPQVSHRIAANGYEPQRTE